MQHDFFQEIKKELIEIKDRIPTISEDNAFVVWFLKAFITDNEDEAFHSIAGMANDKGCDAVYIDHKNRMVFLVQGKYHKFSESNAKLSDVVALAELGRCILLDRKEPFDSLLNKANANVQQKLIEARNQIHRQGYQLILNFVTTGKVSPVHLRQAEANIDEFENARFQSYSKSDLLTLGTNLGGVLSKSNISTTVASTDILNLVRST